MPIYLKCDMCGTVHKINDYIYCKRKIYCRNCNSNYLHVIQKYEFKKEIIIENRGKL